MCELITKTELFQHLGYVAGVSSSAIRPSVSRWITIPDAGISFPFGSIPPDRLLMCATPRSSVRHPIVRADYVIENKFKI